MSFPFFMPMAAQPGLAPLTEDPWLYEAVVVAAAAYASWRALRPTAAWPGSFRPLAASLLPVPLGGAAALLLYVHGLSELLPPDMAPLVGHGAPALMAVGARGPTDALADRSEPTLVVFLRAAWCPFCTREVETMRTLANELGPGEGRIVIVSPELGDFGERGTPPQLHLVADPSGRTFARWGLRDSFLGRPTARPAAFLVGRDGRIRQRFVPDDWRHRLSIDQARLWLREGSP